jgi:hypothetical protein
MPRNELRLVIARDFSDTPGPRRKMQGSHSGEEFLDNLLRPRFKDALRNDAVLTIDFDGSAGYPPAFLETAFWGLEPRVRSVNRVRCGRLARRLLWFR